MDGLAGVNGRLVVMDAADSVSSTDGDLAQTLNPLSGEELVWHIGMSLASARFLEGLVLVSTRYT